MNCKYKISTECLILFTLQKMKLFHFNFMLQPLITSFLNPAPFYFQLRHFARTMFLSINKTLKTYHLHCVILSWNLHRKLHYGILYLHFTRKQFFPALTSNIYFSFSFTQSLSTVTSPACVVTQLYHTYFTPLAAWFINVGFKLFKIELLKCYSCLQFKS